MQARQIIPLFVALVSGLISPASFAADAEAEADTTGGFLLHAQFGLYYRMTSSNESGDDDDYPLVWAWDLTGTGSSRHHANWGLGVHVAIDSRGFRLGPRLQWRRPLTAGSASYVQFAGGPYLLKDDGDLADWPGWFLEAELALNNDAAVVLGYESLNLYEYQSSFSGGYYRGSGWVDTTDNRLYVGVKIGQWGALAATAFIFGLAAVAVSGG